MTNEQAILILEAYMKRLKSSCSNQLDDDIAAFTMAVDALSRSQGMWTFDEDGYFYCGVCNHKPYNQMSPTDYCPHCGARLILFSSVKQD